MKDALAKILEEGSEDPYSAVCAIIDAALDWGTDWPMAGRMSQTEYENLEAIWDRAHSRDPASFPKGGGQ